MCNSGMGSALLSPPRTPPMCDLLTAGAVLTPTLPYLKISVSQTTHNPVMSYSQAVGGCQEFLLHTTCISVAGIIL